MKMALISLALVIFAAISAANAVGYKRVCVYTNWAQYRPGNGQFVPENIDASLCTHAIYAFASMSGNNIIPYEWNDDDTDWQVGMYTRFNNLKNTYPDFKTLLGVGGWNFGTAKMTAMLATEANRAEFCSSSIVFLRQRNFDGLDLHFQYPGNRGSPPADKQNFALLVKECHEAFEAEATANGVDRLLLTAGVAAIKGIIDTAYDIPEITQYLDFVTLMTYDLRGSWDYKTAHHSPITAFGDEIDHTVQLNIEYAANYWAEGGCPSEKIVVGIPMYQRGFTLETAANNSLGDPTIDGNRFGAYTLETGILSYYEVCEKIVAGAERQWIAEQSVPYAVLGDQWYGYDDPESVEAKVNFVKSNNYGGYMLWTMDFDDFRGSFCGGDKYPLHTKAKDTILQEN